jgi:hypothetical protein
MFNIDYLFANKMIVSGLTGYGLTRYGIDD